MTPLSLCVDSIRLNFFALDKSNPSHEFSNFAFLWAGLWFSGPCSFTVYSYTVLTFYIYICI